MAPLLATRERSDRAFEKLYQRHVGDVYRYALVVMRNPADAEDVTQTTFMNAYRAFARGERPRAPQNWLIAIAHNVCRQRFRQLQRRPNETPFDEDVAQAVTDDDDGPTAEDIRRALSHLAFNQRAALVMRELEGRSYAEIAEVLGVSTSAVETLIFRARRALREQLEGGLTCNEAEFAISRQLDGRLPRNEKGALRAHLRECEECARFARSQRAQRSAIRNLALIPVPSSLTSFFHHGGSAAAGAGAATAGAGLATKAALVSASAIVATGVGVQTARKAGLHPLGKDKPKVAATAPGQQQRDAARAGARATRAVMRQTAGASATDASPSPNRAQPTPPVRAHGRAEAPGQLKPKHPVAAPNEHGRKPAVPPGQEKKPAKIPPAHAKHKAGPGGSVLRPPPPPHAKKKAGPGGSVLRPPKPQPQPRPRRAENTAPAPDEPKQPRRKTKTTTTEESVDAEPVS